MKMKLRPLGILLAVAVFPLGCAITDYAPWTGHHTSGEAKLVFDEIAFSGFDPRLDGTYAYTVVYDDSNTPAAGYPNITINSYHNNGFVGTNPPAFDPDGLADRTGVDMQGRYAPYSFFPPWSKDQKWGKIFVSVDSQIGCQFFTNIKQDYSKSAFGPATALCFTAAQEETADIQELEDFSSLDSMISQIWAGTLAKNFTVNVKAISFNGSVYTMTNALSVAMKSTALRPSTMAIDLSGAAGKELLQAVLNSTVDHAPTRLALSFTGGLSLNLPQAWQISFNHAAIRRALAH